MLSVLTQVLMIVCLVAVIWVTWGYSESFTAGPTSLWGGLSKVFLKGVDANSQAATFSNGVYIPEYVYICFQMTFACITPALFVGSIAERVRFSPLMLFVALWVTLVYFPIAHMVWYWEGPDAVANAALKGAAALDAANADAGWLFQKGALDFAGGTVVHVNAGITGLVLAILMGRRAGFPREPMPPHSLTMTMIGASLLWVGWFGFNAGSNLEANGVTAVAFINTFVATAAAGLSWLLVEQVVRGKPSLLGAASGVVAGLVAITPASGYAGPMGSVVLGLLVSPVCFLLRLHGEDTVRLRRQPRRVRRPLHRRHHRRDPDGRARRTQTGRAGDRRLCEQARYARPRRLSHGRAGVESSAKPSS